LNTTFKSGIHHVVIIVNVVITIIKATLATIIFIIIEAVSEDISQVAQEKQ
jgi:hypothetical protein